MYSNRQAIEHRNLSPSTEKMALLKFVRQIQAHKKCTHVSNDKEQFTWRWISHPARNQDAAENEYVNFSPQNTLTDNDLGNLDTINRTRQFLPMDAELY